MTPKGMATMPKIFSLDAETDGLYGDSFAIGVTVREDGAEIAHFVGRCPHEGANQWVLKNVVPSLVGTSITHKSSKELEEAFWGFWMAHRDGAIVIAHCAYPVETGLFARCVERDLDARQWSGPFPLNDVATLLYQLGEQVNSVDAYMAKHGLSLPDGESHNPYYDAVVAALVWEHASERLTRS